LDHLEQRDLIGSSKKAKELLSRAYPYARPHLWILGLSVLASIGYSSVNSYFVYFTKHVFDGIFLAKDVSRVYLVVLAMIGLGMARFFADSLQSYMVQYSGEKIFMRIQEDLYRRIVRLPVHLFERAPVGDYMSRMGNDSKMVQAIIVDIVSVLTKETFTVFGLVGVLFYLNAKLALVSFVAIPFIFLVSQYSGKTFRTLTRRTQVERSKIFSRLFQTMTGIRVVKSLVREDYETSRLEESNLRLFKVMFRTVHLRYFIKFLNELMGFLGIGFVVWFASRSIIREGFTPGDFVAFITALFSFYDPVKKIGNLNSQMHSAMAGAERVFLYFDPPFEEERDEGELEFGGLREAIRFEGVTFSYDPADAGAFRVEGIDMEIPVGKTVALVGGSGEGKSTLIHLLLRFMEPQSGAIRIDGTDYRRIRLSSLRKRIAVVTQESILFSDTVRENIRYGRLDATDEDVERAAMDVGVYDMIQSLSGGFDMNLSERGVSISGGQRKMVILARALLSNPPILVLDEATSEIDSKMEARIFEAMDRLTQGRTTVVIAHRLSTVKSAHRTYVIQHGRIVQSGTHDELVAQGGRYVELFKEQLETGNRAQ